MLLFTGTLPIEQEIISVKYLTQSVCLNHWSNTRCTPNKVSELAITYSLILFTGSIKNDHAINLLE